MKLKALAALLISLIGFYSIFSAILVAGIPLIMLIMAPFQSDGIDYVGFMTLMCIPQFGLPFLFGVFLIRKAAWFSHWLLARIGLNDDQTTGGVNVEDVSFLGFSLLGIYMLSITIPNALQVLAAWFQAKASETMIYSGLGISSENFWSERFPDLLFHTVSIGFAAFVFFRGKSIARFVLSLRMAGTRPQEENKLVR
jgi:hypothetical protein